MKIGLVLESFDPGKGGLEHWTWQFARTLVARGHEVHVVAFNFHPNASEDNSIVLHRVEIPRSRLERAAALEKKLRGMDLDVIHDMGHGWFANIFHPHGGSTIALWEHNLLRIPRWRQIRFWREKRYRQMAEIERRQHEREEAAIVAVSRMVQRHFETLRHLPPERMRLIYNGVDVNRFSPAHREQHRARMRGELGINDGVLFLMLAHNLLLKNAPVLIRAAARLADAGHPARVLIVGGKKREPFVRLAEKLGATRIITFLDPVSDPVPLYAAADVFVHPTWYDPCSLVTLEAWASALPVITTRFNGAAELMSAGNEGFVLDAPDDAAALASKMKELLDPALRQRMGEAGRELALKHTFARQTDEFLKLYDEVVAAKKSRAVEA